MQRKIEKTPIEFYDSELYTLCRVHHTALHNTKLTIWAVKTIHFLV